jgi:hypothetical protein
MLVNWFTAWRKWSIIERLLVLTVLIFVALAPVLCIKFLSPTTSLKYDLSHAIHL